MFFPYTGNSILDRRISAAFHVLFCFFKFPVLSAMLMPQHIFQTPEFFGTVLPVFTRFTSLL